MDLLVDIGNTNLKWAYWDSGQLREPGSHAHEGALPAKITDTWLASPAPLAMLVANVAGAGLQQRLTDWTLAHWGLAPTYASSQPFCLGVTNGYREYGSLGVDRWLAIIAAYHRFRRAVLVVDCGTAVTLDAVRDDGQHLGGLIMPGLRMMRAALSSGTRLPPTQADREMGALGNDTVSCIVAGIRQALVGAIERTLQRVPTGSPNNPLLVFTGGDGESFADRLGGPYEPHLVLQGLALSAREH